MMTVCLVSQGGRFPLECLNHMVQIAFPSSAYNTSEAAKVSKILEK